MTSTPQPASKDEPLPLAVHEFGGIGAARDHDLEALWFSLCDPMFTVVTLVPVPGVEGSDVVDLASRLAGIGAWISGSQVVVVDALGLSPADVMAASALLENLRGLHSQLLIVVQAPTIEPAAIPMLRASERVVLVVGLGSSRSREISAMNRVIAPDGVFGAICLGSKRR